MRCAQMTLQGVAHACWAAQGHGKEEEELVQGDEEGEEEETDSEAEDDEVAGGVIPSANCTSSCLMLAWALQHAKLHTACTPHWLALGPGAGYTWSP